MKSNRNRQGFAVVEGLLILVAIALVAGVGVFVWHSTKVADKTLSNATISSSQTSSTRAKDTSVHQSTFANLPADLRSAIASHAECTNSQGQLTLEGGSVDTNIDNSYVSNEAAFIHECNTVALYAYIPGQWKFVAQTQEGFYCSTLKQYDVPTSLVEASVPENQCLDENNNLATYE